MQSFKTAIGIFLWLVLTIGHGTAVLAEVSTPIDKADVPPAVIDSFKIAFPNLEFDQVEQGEIEGKKFYQFDCLQDDMEFDVVYLEDGSFYATKKEVDIDDLPTEVVDALSIAYPDADIVEADVVAQGADSNFEVEVLINESDEVMEYEVLVSSEGTIISSQAVDNEDEDEDEGDSLEEDDGKE